MGKTSEEGPLEVLDEGFGVEPQHLNATQL